MPRSRLFSLLLLAILLALASPAAAADLEVVFIDVGQGDSILVVSPEGKTVLVDAGTPKAASAVLRELKRRGIRRLDLALVTHAHNDHVGGMAEVLSKVPARFYMDSGVAHPSRAYDKLLKVLEREKVPVRKARAGRKVNLGGGAVLTLLAPEEPLLHGTRSDVNANSVVSRITFGDFSVLLTGDAEQPTEARLVKQGGLRSTVLKVAHHGARYSSTPAFLSRVRPEVAVISVGADNTYGHPTRETLRRLETLRARVLRTDRDGTVVVRSDGHGYTVQTRASGHGRARGAAAAPR